MDHKCVNFPFLCTNKLWYGIPIKKQLWYGIILLSHQYDMIWCQLLLYRLISGQIAYYPNCSNISTILYINHNTRGGNFAPPRLTRPSPFRPVRVFPAPQRWWGGDGVRFQTRITGRGGDGFTLFRPTPPHPHPVVLSC